MLAAATAAVSAALASPHAALALSGGSMGGCSSSSSSCYSSSSSSSSGDSWWSSSSSSSSPKKKTTENNADLETDESVGTAASPPPQVVLSPWEKFWLSVAVVLGFVGLVFGLLFLIKTNLPPPRTTSVIKLQVALRGVAAAKSFQKDLNKIAERVRGSSPRWYKFILTETISSLLCHKVYYMSTSLSVDEDNEYSWNDHFKRISLEERSKFDEETLSNLEGIKRKKVYSTKTDGSKNEYIALTILVAADGTLDFPQAIRSSADLETALAKLNSTAETDLQGVHVLWAPQDEEDILSKERMQKDYSYLKPLSV